MLALAHLQGLTHSEAAKHLEISEKEGEKEVRRGRPHLRRWLWLEDDGTVSGSRGASGRGGERALAALYGHRGWWGWRTLTTCRLLIDAVSDRELGIQIQHTPGFGSVWEGIYEDPMPDCGGGLCFCRCCPFWRKKGADRL